MKIRVLIADDHAVLRAGLRLLLNGQPDMEVVGEATDTTDVVKVARDTRPDVVLLDLAMPGQGGLSALAALRQSCPETRVLVLTMHDDPAYLRAVLDAGGDGYMIKSSADSELLSAIRSVQQGRPFVDKAFGEDVLQSTRTRKPMRPGKWAEQIAAITKPLSAREREVLTLLAHGYTNQEVADRLELSVKSVETYRSRLMEKLGLRSRAELIRYALEHGVLKPGRSLAKV